MSLAILVGNAPPQTDWKKKVDGADFVARINTCMGLGQEYGSRTDRVYLCNTGGVARRFLHSHDLHALIARSGAKEVVFSYPRVPLARKIHCILRGKRGTGVDRTHALSAALNQWGIDCDAMPQGVFDNVAAFVRSREEFAEFSRAHPLWIPSSGGLALAHMASEPALAQHQIGIVGFGFKGWAGHPWFAEEAYAQRLAECGRLVFLDTATR